MMITKEQKKELNRLDTRYDQMNKISQKAGMNPDKLIYEFSDNFMDVSELNRQLIDEWNERRYKTYKSTQPNKAL